MPINRRQFIKRSIYWGIGALVASYPLFIERYRFQINTYKIPVPNLPPEFDGFTIVHLTDIHYGFLMSLSVVKKLLDKANSIKRDIIVCTGDSVHQRNSASQIDTLWPQLSKLTAPGGVYSVLGTHDHWADFSRSQHWLNKSGQNLRHKAISIKRDAERIWIGGCGDYMEDQIGLDHAFRNVPPEDCKIALAHNPDTADTFFKTRVDLMICGHTHGGQVKIPFWGTPILPVHNKSYSSGLVSTSKTRVFISKGLGWAILPVRFNCLPEIAVLKLLSADNLTTSQSRSSVDLDV
jgi:predicted MPP superfamily phosphohydrolase